MPAKFNETVCDIVGALDRENVAVKEITRRLNDGEAGLDYAVDISERSVYDYRAAYRKRHGPPPTEEIGDQTFPSTVAAKKRILERVFRELQYLETVPAGKLTQDDATLLRRLFATVDDAERREQMAEKRRGRSPSKANGKPEKQETAIERLAREAREAQANGSPG